MLSVPLPILQRPRMRKIFEKIIFFFLILIRKIMYQNSYFCDHLPVTFFYGLQPDGSTRCDKAQKKNLKTDHYKRSVRRVKDAPDDRFTHSRRPRDFVNYVRSAASLHQLLTHLRVHEKRSRSP